MIGVNTSIFKSAGRKLVNLLGALKDRAAYYENGTDSVAEKNRIDDLGVLDKATILLTPTATSDARVHSVKTYTGDELLDVSSLSGTNWTADGSGGFTNNGSGGALVGSLNVNATPGATYKFTFDVTISGVANASFGGVTVPNFTTSGPKEYYVTATSSSTSFNFYLAPSGTPSMFVNNISIVDVSSDFDFDRASSATRINSDGLVQDMQSITDPELVLNGDFEELGDELVTNGDFATDSDWTATYGESQSSIVISNNQLSFTSTVAYGFANQEINVTSGKTYKMLVDIDSFSGSMRIFSASGNDAKIISSTGLIEFYFVPDANTTLIGFSANNDVGASVVVNSISVKQVNVDSEGNDIWSLGDGWSIEDGKLVGTSVTTQFAQQSFTFINGNTYKITFDITGADTLNDDTSFRLPYDGTGGNISYLEKDSPDGTYSHTFVAGTSSILYLGYIDNGTYTGTIDNISVKDITFSTDVDLARINYDSNGENGHILLEPTSTNLVGYSLPNDTNWSKGINTTITENYAVSPDGTQNASRFVMPTGSGTYAYYQFTATSTADHTLSFYAKNNGGDADVTMAFFAPSGAKDITLTNEWQRFEFTRPVTSGNAVQVGVDNITSVDMLIYGVQCEALPYATSYIPSLTGSTVTRAAETLNGSGNSTLINSTEGVLYAEIAALSDVAGRWISLSNGTTDQRVSIAFQGADIRLYIKNAGGLIWDYTYTGANIFNYNKIALKYKGGDYALWINGTEVRTDSNSNLPSGLNGLQFDSGAGGSDFYGKCKALAIFNEALEDDELELLTGVTNYGSFSELASANGYTII